MREPDILDPLPGPAPIIEPTAPEGLFPVSRAAQRRAVRSRERRGWQRLALSAGALALLWGGLTGWDPASWVIGLPVVAAATALVFRFAPAPAWRLSLPGALHFAAWFLLASARSALDVAGRAFAWEVALRPGFRLYRTHLPAGAPRIFFANAISLLPGTLSAEITGDRIEVHMLDTGADLAAELADLETRVRRVFALPDPSLAHDRPLPLRIEDSP